MPEYVSGDSQLVNSDGSRSKQMMDIDKRWELVKSDGSMVEGWKEKLATINRGTDSGTEDDEIDRILQSVPDDPVPPQPVSQPSGSEEARSKSQAPGIEC